LGEIVAFEATMHTEIWEAVAGEVLGCVREPHNVQNRYAVAVNIFE